MSGERPEARSRGRHYGGGGVGEHLGGRKQRRMIRRERNQVLGPMSLMNVNVRTFFGFGFGAVAFLAIILYLAYRSDMFGSRMVSTDLMRVVTPLHAPKMLDLPQFQGEHKESLYWGTYRPQVYLGIRARTPQSLIAGLMWIGVKKGQYFMRHVCQDSDELSMYGWTDHNGRDYGNQVIVDHGLHLTTSFLKDKGIGSGHGGDWAIRVDLQHHKENLGEAKLNVANLFFYIASEGGQPLKLGSAKFPFHGSALLAFGSQMDVGGWELHLRSDDELEIHYAGFRTLSMHNLTELVQGTLAFHARTTGRLQLPDILDSSSNIIVFQVTSVIPSKWDIAFLSGTDSRSSMVEERLNNITGSMMTSQLARRQKDFEEKYIRTFNLYGKSNLEDTVVGRAAIANLLGSIGYFHGQSKIALPKGSLLNYDNKFVAYWTSELYTAVPSRSFFPRGFLWDEGFHQLLIWRWDVHISMDIIAHWLDLINVDGWIPREQILGAEALSKVPEEFIPQHPTNGNPPTLFLPLRDLVNGLKAQKFSKEEAQDIYYFLKRAYTRLDAWFKWFNTTQSGRAESTFYWHGRDNTTNMELNPKTLSSGLDDYPRSSHPSDEERHLDLRCWMYLAASCMDSMGELLGSSNSSQDYYRMSEELSSFEILNKMHFDDVHGAYFDFGNNTERVFLRWIDVTRGEHTKRELIRVALDEPHLSLVPHVGYVSLFPFMMGIIPAESPILGKQIELISNHSTLWTDYGIRSLSKTSSMYMKRNTEHDAPYWRGPIWINMNYMILAGLHHYSKANGPYKTRASTVYSELRSNLIRNIVKNYYETGFLWEQYDEKNKGKGKGARPFTGWTALVVLIMAESYPTLPNV